MVTISVIIPITTPTKAKVNIPKLSAKFAVSIDTVIALPSLWSRRESTTLDEPIYYALVIISSCEMFGHTLVLGLFLIYRAIMSLPIFEWQGGKSHMANEELINILRSVIKDELAPIKDELQSVKMELLDNRAQMNSRFDTVEAKLSRVETSVLRIESNEPTDVMGMLKQINAKLDTNRDLAHKVDDLEMDLRIIKKAISNQ